MSQHFGPWGQPVHEQDHGIFGMMCQLAEVAFVFFAIVMASAAFASCERQSRDEQRQEARQ